MTVGYIGIGSNVGDRILFVRRAVDELTDSPGVEVVKVASAADMQDAIATARARRPTARRPAHTKPLCPTHASLDHKATARSCRALRSRGAEQRRGDLQRASEIAYGEILELFFATHDPTTLNRQGNDRGPQYRSVIFYHNEEQKQKAEGYKRRLNEEKAYDNPVVTGISPYTKFYKAEEFHQNYYDENGSQPYCVFVVKPKLDKFKKVFADKLKK